MQEHYRVVSCLCDPAPAEREYVQKSQNVYECLRCLVLGAILNGKAWHNAGRELNMWV